ncbi:MAG: hypothetical protein J6W47_05310 [Bacteroidales bacterium]|nr:hypothetical protein [Bacteroidales bacterium]
MKKLYYLLICLVVSCSLTTFTSCSSDEEEEIIDDVTIEQYKQNIVGTWRMDGTQEYWRFDAMGGGSVAYGENWDQAEDVNEGEGNQFQWSINSNGLMVIYKIGSLYSDPEPDAPYTIKSITSTKMHWVTSSNVQQSFTKVK